MKIIGSPSVYLIGQQQINEAELSRFLADEGVEKWETDTLVAGQKLVEIAGRLCYMSYAKPRPGGNKAYIDHILDVRHGSVLEHAVFNLLVTGVSRSLTHELVRHRVGNSPSQLSQRYVDETKGEEGIEFVIPPLISEARRVRAESGDSDMRIICSEIEELWQNAMASSERRYEKLSLRLYQLAADLYRNTDSTHRVKIAREAARSVLPNATETKIFLTGNVRAWRHLIETRGTQHADAEIRNLALEILKVLTVASPGLFGDYVVVPTDDGSFNITTDHPKV
jgi:thymidylate synthase (FAD)